MTIQIINGPNLNLLGLREPDVYGDTSFNQFLEELRKMYPRVDFQYFQSNIEGELINQIQECGIGQTPIILNAGGYTHTSVSLRDAILASQASVVEVHISNVFGREPFRYTSLIAPVCIGSIIGFGLDGYRLAVEALIK